MSKKRKPVVNRQLMCSVLTSTRNFVVKDVENTWVPALCHFLICKISECSSTCVRYFRYLKFKLHVFFFLYIIWSKSRELYYDNKSLQKGPFFCVCKYYVKPWSWLSWSNFCLNEKLKYLYWFNHNSCAFSFWSILFLTCTDTVVNPWNRGETKGNQFLQTLIFIKGVKNVTQILYSWVFKQAELESFFTRNFSEF